MGDPRPSRKKKTLVENIVWMTENLYGRINDDDDDCNNKMKTMTRMKMKIVYKIMVVLVQRRRRIGDMEMGK